MLGSLQDGTIEENGNGTPQLAGSPLEGGNDDVLPTQKLSSGNGVPAEGPQPPQQGNGNGNGNKTDNATLPPNSLLVSHSISVCAGV